MTMRGELALVDTNILLTATDSSRPVHKSAKELFFRAPEAGVHLCITSQIIREYLVVATRPPEVNGLGLISADAVHNMKAFQRRMLFLEESESVSAELLLLVKTHNISGKVIHDCNLAAHMHESHIQMLITENPSDFSRFSGIQAFSTESFLKALES